MHGETLPFHGLKISTSKDPSTKERDPGQLMDLDLPRCAKNEEHASIASINDLVASVLQEVCIPGISSHYSAVDLRLDLELFHCIEGHIPLRQTGLTLPILEQDETNHRWYLKFGPPQTYIFEPHAAGHAKAQMLSKVHRSTASLPLGVRKENHLSRTYTFLLHGIL